VEEIGFGSRGGPERDRLYNSLVTFYVDPDWALAPGHLLLPEGPLLYISGTLNNVLSSNMWMKEVYSFETSAEQPK
jgi:hypothetical protein